MSNNKIDWIVEGIKRTLPRGMRNNNPLNVKRFPNSSWIGMKVWVALMAAMQNVECGKGYVIESKIEQAFKLLF